MQYIHGIVPYKLYSWVDSVVHLLLLPKELHAKGLKIFALTGCVDDREPQLDSLLLNLHCRLLNFDRPLRSLLHRRDLPVGVQIYKSKAKTSDQSENTHRTKGKVSLYSLVIFQTSLFLQN